LYELSANQTSTNNVRWREWRWVR